MIVHSHPSSQKNHKHTTAQVITIAQLHIVNAVEPTVTAYQPVIPNIISEFEYRCPVIYIQSFYKLHFNLRAPPYYC